MGRKSRDGNNYVWRVIWVDGKTLHTAYYFNGPDVSIYGTNSKDDALVELRRLHDLNIPVLKKVHPYVKQDIEKRYFGGLGLYY